MLFYLNFPEWLKPQIFGGFPIRWYGLMYIVAFAVAYYLFKYQIREEKGSLSQEDKDDISNFFFWGIAGLILGARLMSTLLYDRSGMYYRKPWLIFWPFKNFQLASPEHIFKGPVFILSIIVLLVSVIYAIYRYQVRSLEKEKLKGKKKNKTNETEGQKKEDSIFFILFLLIIASGILLFTKLFTFDFIGLQGMSYHGGVIGCAIGCILYCKKKKKNLLVYGDYATTAIPLGYTFGRLGNFINGELFGRVTTVPWGMVFPDAHPFPVSEPWVKDVADKIGMDISGKLLVNLPRHPSQLYEAFFEGIILWAILWFLFRKRKPFNGFIIGMYLIGYGIFRFFIEYLREPDAGLDFPIMFSADNPATYLTNTLLNFTTGQILCFIMILAGGGLLLFFNWYDKNRKAAQNDDSGENKTMQSKKQLNLRKLRKKIK